MTTLTGFTRPNPPVGPDLASQIATATGLSITGATVDPTQAIVTGPSITEGNRAAIQTAISAYVYDAAYGLTVKSIFTLNGTQPVTWTNMPSAKTAVAGSLTRLPLYGVSYARLTTDVGVIGAAGAVLIAQVSTDGVTYVDGPSVSIATPTGLKVSSLVAIPAAYQADVFFRLAGQGGDGVADPQFRLTTLQVA